ncbi:MAG: ABC transporter substrate-binding protein [Sedimenticola sp.]
MNKIVGYAGFCLMLLVGMSPALGAGHVGAADEGATESSSGEAYIRVEVVKTPVEVVRETSNLMLAEVASRKEELDEFPGRIYGLVDQIVLPKFDFIRMSKLVLGKYWRRATDEEKASFIAAFRELLVRTYATALLNYSDQEIKYLPSRMVEGAEEVVVNTEVSESGAPAVPINYNLYKDGEDWLVFDVVIDGVSLVSNYRTSFASQIRRYKLAGLIKKLEQRNKRDK